MKKTILSILLLAMLLTTICVLTSCGGRITDFELSDISDEITDSIEFTDLYEMSGDDFYQETGISDEMYSEAVLLLPVDSLQANRVFFFKAVDAENATEIETRMNNYLDYQKTTSETYSPDMYAIFNKSSVVKSGNYVYLVVTDKADEAKEILNKYEFK